MYAKQKIRKLLCLLLSFALKASEQLDWSNHKGLIFISTLLPKHTTCKN